MAPTMQLPIDDKPTYNKDYPKAHLAILMAGRISEDKFTHHGKNCLNVEFIDLYILYPRMTEAAGRLGAI